MQIFDIHFLEAKYLYFLLLVPIILVIFIFIKRKRSIKLLITNDIIKVFWKSNFMYYFKIFIICLILITYILLLADPHKTNIKEKVKKNWIDIVLVLDVSKSMNATDLKPDRIEKAKIVISDFIKKQNTNRVWLIVFAWKPFSNIPLTFDYDILTETLEWISTDILNQNVNWLEWTAIWDALLLSKNIFINKDQVSKDNKELLNREKVIILLTDWDANKWVDPIIVSKLLKEEKIKVYTIWIWSKKWWQIEINNWFFMQTVKIPPLKTKALKEIAKNTWWYFFRATDNNSIEEIFNKLEELEKNDIEIEIVKSFSQHYNFFLNILIILLSLLLFIEIKKVKN